MSAIYCLDSIRAQFEAFLLTDTCQIYEPPTRASATRTPEGSIDTTFSAAWTLSATVPCAVTISRLRSLVSESGGTPENVSYLTVTVPGDTVLTAHSRIKITESINPLLVGNVYDVQSAPIDSPGLLRIVNVKIRDQ